MNKVLNNSLITSLIVTILLGILLLNKDFINFESYILNIITILAYYIILKISYQKSNHNYQELFFITSVYQIIAITVLTQLYISVNGIPFSFTAADSVTYDGWVRESLNISFLESVKYFNSELPLDDIGFPTYLALVYRWSSDPLLSRYLLIIVILLISILVYRIAQNYLSDRFAFMAALSVSISNFSTLYASNGSKELFMVLILMASFYFFIRYIYKKKLVSLIISILISFLLIFFRLPLVFFFLITIAATFLLNKGNKSVFVIFLSLIIIASIFLLYNYYSNAINRFVNISTEDAIERSANSVGESGYFTFFVSIIVGLFGPLPTLFPKIAKEDLSFIGSTLILRVFLSGYIFSAIYFVYKNKLSNFYPLIIYPLLTVVSLILISEVYEARFHLMHIPLLIIIGFYGVENKLIRGKILSYVNILMVLIIIYWNFGRI